MRRTGKLYLNVNEHAELNAICRARTIALGGVDADSCRRVLALIPTFNVDMHFWGMGADAKIFGGDKLSERRRAISGGLRTSAAANEDSAGH